MCDTPEAPPLDLCGLVCPMPVIRLGEAAEWLLPGGRLGAVADDPAFADDLPAWCEATGHRLLYLETDDAGRIHVLIEKTASEETPCDPG